MFAPEAWAPRSPPPCYGPVAPRRHPTEKQQPCCTARTGGFERTMGVDARQEKTRAVFGVRQRANGLFDHVRRVSGTPTTTGRSRGTRIA